MSDCSWFDFTSETNCGKLASTHLRIGRTSIWECIAIVNTSRDSNSDKANPISTKPSSFGPRWWDDGRVEMLCWRWQTPKASWVVRDEQKQQASTAHSIGRASRSLLTLIALRLYLLLVSFISFPRPIRFSSIRFAIAPQTQKWLHLSDPYLCISSSFWFMRYSWNVSSYYHTHRSFHLYIHAFPTHPHGLLGRNHTGKWIKQNLRILSYNRVPREKVLLTKEKTTGHPLMETIVTDGNLYVATRPSRSQACFFLFRQTSR